MHLTLIQRDLVLHDFVFIKMGRFRLVRLVFHVAIMRPRAWTASRKSRLALPAMLRLAPLRGAFPVIKRRAQIGEMQEVQPMKIAPMLGKQHR
jgi:hypothetical protein